MSQWMSKKFLLSTLVFTSANFAFAADEVVHRHHTTTRSESGFLPSLQLSYANLSQSGRSDLDGDAMGAKAVMSAYFTASRWMADLGLGVEKYSLTGGIDPTVGVVSTSARYRFRDRWALGPAADMIVGNGETFGSTTNQTILLGILGTKGVPLRGDHMLKLGAKFSGGILQAGQSSSHFGLSLEWAMGAESSLLNIF
jgi:hypothetical protein